MACLSEASFAGLKYARQSDRPRTSQSFPRASRSVPNHLQNEIYENMDAPLEQSTIFIEKIDAPLTRNAMATIFHCGHFTAE